MPRHYSVSVGGDYPPAEIRRADHHITGENYDNSLRAVVADMPPVNLLDAFDAVANDAPTTNLLSAFDGVADESDHEEPPLARSLLDEFDAVADEDEPQESLDPMIQMPSFSTMHVLGCTIIATQLMGNLSPGDQASNFNSPDYW